MEQISAFTPPAQEPPHPTPWPSIHAHKRVSSIPAFVFCFSNVQRSRDAGKKAGKKRFCLLSCMFFICALNMASPKRSHLIHYFQEFHCMLISNQPLARTNAVTWLGKTNEKLRTMDSTEGRSCRRECCRLEHRVQDMKWCKQRFISWHQMIGIQVEKLTFYD